MQIEKITVTVDDGSSDNIGGVHYEREAFPVLAVDPVKIKCSNEYGNYEITLSGEELDRLKSFLENIRYK